MNFEVENKYRLADPVAVQHRLAELGAAFDEPQLQVDTYFAHPARDFGQTDEALRIRRVGESNYITYKGPKLDATTKTRRELELPLPLHEQGAVDFQELLQALGFRPVRQVSKQRRKAVISWAGFHVEAALDEVAGLGQFIELELTVDEADVAAAKDGLASLAESLGLRDGERRSYLELLIEAEKG